ncbi:MAG: DUF2278 family protein [Chlorobiaceae bacterium]
MSLYDGYGVLVGTLQKYYCDHASNDGTYYHCNIKVSARGKVFRCPVDLDSKKDAHGLQWRVVEMVPGALHQILHFQEGWHPLDSKPGSGAIDYYRSPELQPTCDCREVASDSVYNDATLCRALRASWKYGTGPAAFSDLEPLLRHSRKLFIFGEPFRTGKGVHNIHQNQGDPPESKWFPENGIWQDGAVIVLRRDKTLVAFLCKFNTQLFFADSICSFSSDSNVTVTDPLD